MPVWVALRALAALGVAIPHVLQQCDLVGRGHYPVLQVLGPQQRVDHARLAAVELALEGRPGGGLKEGSLEKDGKRAAEFADVTTKPLRQDLGSPSNACESPLGFKAAKPRVGECKIQEQGPNWCQVDRGRWQDVWEPRPAPLHLSFGVNDVKQMGDSWPHHNDEQEELVQLRQGVLQQRQLRHLMRTPSKQSGVKASQAHCLSRDT